MQEHNGTDYMLFQQFLRAEQLGVRLEIVGGLPIGPRFYLSQAVKDVVVFDPDTLLVLHVRRDGASRQISPVVLGLECGCVVNV